MKRVVRRINCRDITSNLLFFFKLCHHNIIYTYPTKGTIIIGAICRSRMYRHVHQTLSERFLICILKKNH